MRLFQKKKTKNNSVNLGGGQLNIDALMEVAERNLGHKPTADELVDMLVNQKSDDKHIKRAQAAFRMLKAFGYKPEMLRETIKSALHEGE